MRDSSKKHIVFLRRCPASLSWGGLEKLTLEWFQRIDYSKCRVTYIVSAGWKDWFKRRFEGKDIYVDILEFPFEYKGRFIKKFLSLWKFLCGLKPEEVVFLQGSFICFSFDYVLAGYLTSKGNVYMHENLAAPEPPSRTRRRYLGVIPGLALWWYIERHGNKFRAYLCKKIFTVGQELKDRLISLWGYPVEKIQLKYHGIETKEFLPDPDVCRSMRKNNYISDTDIVIISTARMSQEKALHRIIEAFNRLSRSYKNLRLLLLGSGPLENDLKNLAQKCENENRIKFLGHQDNVADWLKMSDIYVLSSDTEGFSLAVLEAMCSGLVCVTTRCPGTNEIIKDGINGFLVEKTAEGVFQGLKKALRLTPGQKKNISNTASEHVCRNFEINNQVQDIFAAMGVPFVPFYSTEILKVLKRP